MLLLEMEKSDSQHIQLKQNKRRPSFDPCGFHLALCAHTGQCLSCTDEMTLNLLDADKLSNFEVDFDIDYLINLYKNKDTEKIIQFYKQYITDDEEELDILFPEGLMD